MSDDSLALASHGEAGEALGSYPGLRLWPDVIPSLCGASPRLSPVAHYSGDESADDLEREFGILTRLASRRLVRRLRVAQDLWRLAEARAAVLADLSDDA